MDTRARILELEQAAGLAGRLQADARPLIVAAGCFDVLQAGHAGFLQGLRPDSHPDAAALPKAATVTNEMPGLVALAAQTPELSAHGHARKDH
jgi:bifunctional ADP-heptose synthase (sugar kinase/adenylyltransferase)